jgi:phospholipase C
MRNLAGNLARRSRGVPRCSTVFALMLALAAGCASHAGGGPLPTDALSARARATSASPIKHVVIIIQENRSFENLFAGFPGADAPMYGYYHKHKVRLATVDFVHWVNLNHFFEPAIKAWDHGKMDDFDGRFSYLPKLYPYAHLDRPDVAPYWSMARQYVLADHMFPTEFGPSFTGHLTLIAGTDNLSPTKAEADNPIGGPWGCDAFAGTYTFAVNAQRIVKPDGGFPCFTQFRTLGDALDAAGVSWKYYAPPISGPNMNKGGVLWSTFDAIKSIRYSPDWEGPNPKIVQQTNVLSDAARGRLPAVSWVIPDWDWSDHTSSGSDMGPSWVSAVVNAIGTGPDWRSTAIVVVWDDWGGWYDNVPPPQLDFRGLGIRVGCIIISPYVHPHVDHTQYEFGSILKFVEQTFNVPPIGSTGVGSGYTDTRATSILNAFDFTMQPRPFVKISAKYPPSTFLKFKPSMRPPDDDLPDM